MQIDPLQYANRLLATSLDRRALLKNGALLLCAGFAPPALTADAKPDRTARSAGSSSITAWVRIAPNNSITLLASQSEMGQGTSTTLAAILADELYLPLARVKIEFAPFAPEYRDPVYQWMFTGNSQGIMSFYDVMRTMGAAAREMLIAAAATRLGVPARSLICKDGILRSGERSLTFGDVAADAAKLPIPAQPTPRADSALVGRRTQRWDVPSKVDGSAVFGIDVKLPNLLTAVVRCAPRFGAKVVKYDAAKVKAMPGVVDVVTIPNGIAIAAKHYWQARTALDAANIEWSDEGSSFTSGATLAPIYEQRLARGPFYTFKNSGDAARAVASASIKLAATYQIPFQAHATLEPMNCTAHVTADRCEVWAPTQGVEMAQNVAATVTGLPSDKVIVHRTFLGGGFGRRLLADFIKQAVLVSQALKQPVKLIWSREEDMTHDFYRPAMLHEIRGALDAGGKVAALTHRIVSPSHMLYIFPRAMFPNVKDWTDPAAPPEKMDVMAVEGVLEIPYDVASETVEAHRLEVDVPVSVWRTTGHGPNNFVLESFVDELAAAAKVDPLQFRLTLLERNPRARRVLEVLAEKSRWSTALPNGTFRGVAIAVAFGGVIANAVELSVQDKNIKLRRIVSVVDCGRTLDPAIAESNILGGIVWGISGMKTAATFANGRAEFSNFDRFDPAHLWETPPCEVHFIESGEKLGGTGELGPVPIHAAVCNAVFAATGERLRALPLSIFGFSFV